jgi:hypothetical protein
MIKAALDHTYKQEEYHNTVKVLALTIIMWPLGCTANGRQAVELKSSHGVSDNR